MGKTHRKMKASLDALNLIANLSPEKGNTVGYAGILATSFKKADFKKPKNPKQGRTNLLHLELYRNRKRKESSLEKTPRTKSLRHSIRAYE